MSSWTSSDMSTSNANVKYTITISENGTSVVDNTSDVTVSVRFYRTNTGYATYGNGTVYCVIDGTTYSAVVTPSQKITNNGVILFSKTLSVLHDSNGSKTLSTSAHITHDVVTSTSQSYSHALTTIPRASELSVTDGTLGVAQTISVTRKSDAFTHTITWVCGSSSGSVCSKSNATSWSFTPNGSLAANAKYDTSVYCEFTLTTYSGNTAIGSSTKGVRLAIPDSMKPVVQISLTDPNGHVAKYGGYISGQSSVKVTLSTSLSYGSPIRSYTTQISDAYKRIYTASSFTSEPLTLGSGIPGAYNVAIDSTIVDGRGRSADASATIQVLPYALPVVRELSVKRCNSDGTQEDDRGAHALITYGYRIQPLNNANSKKVSIRYRQNGLGTWTTVNLSNPGYALTSDSLVISADEASSYDIEVVLQDDFATVTSSTTLSTGYCLYHIPASGKGITFGGIAEGDGFNVKMPAHFSDGVTYDIPNILTGSLNTLKDSGEYHVDNMVTNRPVAINGWLIVRSYNDSYCCQTYITHSGVEYRRMLQGNTWGTWKQISSV